MDTTNGMVSLAHIINPVGAEKGSDLAIAQPITFETMSLAREFAKDMAAVNLYAVQFQGEAHAALGEEFVSLPGLTRSVNDIKTFKINRRLPLIKDILDALAAAAGHADYLIYTNVDIGLQPHFYSSIARIIEQGSDGFVINRRTIPDRYHDVNQIPFMYAEVGESHPGYDCFVFRRDAYPQFKLGAICIGTAWIGRALLANMVAYAGKFREFRNEHLTFHIGDSMSWRQDEYHDYFQENWNEYLRLFGEIEADRGGFDPELRSYLLDTGSARRIPDFSRLDLQSGNCRPLPRGGKPS
jgi:hypothetical protein